MQIPVVAAAALIKVARMQLSCAGYVNGGLKKNKRLEVVVFKIMIKGRLHISLLMEHRKSTLKGVTPLLLGEGGTE